MHGGKENLGAIQFLRELNEAVYRDHPDVQVIAEESTSWPMVSRPMYLGGLGFGMKWNMGWMHDTLDYFSQPPIHRKHHQGRLTFSIWYAFFENFVLPLSHDEVVYGKGSLIGKMPGDDWQQFANLRLLFGYMWGHPGKKLLFMGGEFGQRREWTHEGALEWWVLQYPEHAGVQRWVADLNSCIATSPRCMRSISMRPASNGSIATTRRKASCRSCAARVRDRLCSSFATSRRCRAKITSSAFPRAVIGASCSTATRCTTVAAGSAIWAEPKRPRLRRTVDSIRCR